MKRTLLALLLICMLGMLSGCQTSDIENSETNSETSQSEVENLTETEIASMTETSSSETENVENPTPVRYELIDYEPASNLGHTLDLAAFDTKIYAVLKQTGKSDVIESNTNPYYFVSFDKAGSNFTQVNLETPAIENEFIQLKLLTIGQNQRVYALKIAYIPDSGSYDTPTLEKGLRLVCWNLDGTIQNDVPLTIPDIELGNPSSTYITNISISEDGTVLLCCHTLGEPSSIVSLTPDGAINKIVKGEDLHTNVHFNKNNDGTLFAIQAEYAKGEITHSYYLGYDTDTQEFLPEILLKDIRIFSAYYMEGNHEAISFIQDNKIYNYHLETQEIHLLIDLAYNNLSGFHTILPFDENSYICTYTSNGTRHIGFLKQIP